MRLKFFIVLFTILIALPAYSKEMINFSYLFSGRWQPAEDPLLMDEFGIADIQNLRKEGKRLRGVDDGVFGIRHRRAGSQYKCNSARGCYVGFAHHLHGNRTDAAARS